MAEAILSGRIVSRFASVYETVTRDEGISRKSRLFARIHRTLRMSGSFSREVRHARKEPPMFTTASLLVLLVSIPILTVVLLIHTTPNTLTILNNTNHRPALFQCNAELEASRQVFYTSVADAILPCRERNKVCWQNMSVLLSVKNADGEVKRHSPYNSTETQARSTALIKLLDITKEPCIRSSAIKFFFCMRTYSVVKLISEIWAAINKVLRADWGKMRLEWSSAGMQEQGKREILEKTRRPAASEVAGDHEWSLFRLCDLRQAVVVRRKGNGLTKGGRRRINRQSLPADRRCKGPHLCKRVQVRRHYCHASVPPSLSKGGSGGGTVGQGWKYGERTVPACTPPSHRVSKYTGGVAVRLLTSQTAFHPRRGRPRIFASDTRLTMPLVGEFSLGAPVPPRSPCIAVLRHTYFASPSSALKTSMVRAAHSASIWACPLPDWVLEAVNRILHLNGGRWAVREIDSLKKLYIGTVHHNEHNSASSHVCRGFSDLTYGDAIVPLVSDKDRGALILGTGLYLASPSRTLAWKLAYLVNPLGLKFAQEPRVSASCKDPVFVLPKTDCRASVHGLGWLRFAPCRAECMGKLAAQKCALTNVVKGRSTADLKGRRKVPACLWHFFELRKQLLTKYNFQLSWRPPFELQSMMLARPCRLRVNQRTQSGRIDTSAPSCARTTSRILVVGAGIKDRGREKQQLGTL
ncbi:hypothetical protein PR048_018670 [Dryococelus australis]|uniref:Uncharacterized protein n=1 Tax=Dryococelus australis TaxID=614101 RepID=A0ABQ9HCW9_9NEOP|nr:hypothetical protein PR048_018670 [Dryococelus australis]